MPQPVFFFRYEVIAEELVKAGIPPNEIFFFDGTPQQEVFRNYLNITQTMLYLAETEYNMQPARFIYNNNTTINAKAGRLAGVYIISMNAGLIVNTTAFFQDNFAFLDNNKTAFVQKVLQVVPDSTAELMRDFCVRFTIDHEFAHLVQKKRLQQNWMQQEYAAEGANDFSVEHHVYEFDADMWGAVGVGSAMKTYFDGLPKEHQTDEVLRALITICIASLQCKFFLGQRSMKEMYFNQYKHPHPIIRSVYIGNHLRQIFFENHIGRHLDWHNINGNAIYLASELLKHAGTSLGGSIVVTYVQHYRRIQEYIQQTIMDNIGKYNNLVLHKPPSSALEVTWEKLLNRPMSEQQPEMLNYFRHRSAPGMNS